jgi:putative ABC transport system substrate-binding protein
MDVLMATYDLRIFSAEHARSIMLFSYRHRIPVIGSSDAWSRAGALMSFDWDYHDIGHQCGEYAVRLLQTKGLPYKPAVERPRRLRYSLNLEAARYFQIRLAPDLLEGAWQRFN